jgi:hypothetical protein
MSLPRHLGALWLVTCVAALPAHAQQEARPAAPATAFSARDLGGIWSHPGGARDAPARLNAPTVVHPESNWSTEKLPFTDAGRTVFEANKPTGGPRQVKGQVSPNDPRDKGNPLGLYRMMQFSGGTRVFEIGSLNGNIVQLFSVGRIFRTIYTDGRPVPDTVAAGPFWYGQSVGRWENDTLVVTTQALDDRQWLDGWGTPISLDARIVERWRRVAPDELQMTITVNDPTYYTKAWTSPPEVFRRAKKGIEPDEIIYAPVDIEGYGREILLPSSNQATQ